MLEWVQQFSQHGGYKVHVLLSCAIFNTYNISLQKYVYYGVCANINCYGLISHWVHTCTSHILFTGANLIWLFFYKCTATQTTTNPPPPPPPPHFTVVQISDYY